MAYTGEALRLALPFLEKLPDDVCFDTALRTEALKIQARTQEEVKKIQKAFPPVVWKRTWDDYCKWWEYTCTVPAGSGEELEVVIYAVKEAPPQCRPIVERRRVKKQVPVAFEEKEVEEEVIVGWDCNGGKPR